MRYNLSSLTTHCLLITVACGCSQESRAPRDNLATARQSLDASPLMAEYYKSKDLTGEKVVTQDDNIDFNWMEGAPLSGFPSDNFSVRWTGRVTPPASGNYTFYIYDYDGARVWVNGQLIIDDWAWDEGEEASVPLALTGGQAYDLKVEYFEGAGAARAHLSWSGPGITGKVPVPPEALSAPGGLTAEYYKTIDLSGEKVVTHDDKIDFNWMEGAPLPGFPSDNFSARWTGKITPPATGNFTFYTYTYDGGRLWINGQLAIDDWAWDEGEEASVPIALVGGQAYDLKLEYYEGGGAARAHLSWSGPSTGGKVIVPPGAFSATSGSPSPSPSCTAPEPLPSPLKTTEIYRNDFEGEDPNCWATKPTAGCNGVKVYERSKTAGSSIVSIASNEQHHSGQKALRIRFATDEDEGGGQVNPNATHIFYRHYDYYQSPDFDFAGGMKIARFSGHDSAAGKNQFDIILVTGAQKTSAGNFCGTNAMAQMFLQRNDPDMGANFGNQFPSVSFPRGQWISVETEIKLNTPGLADGEVRVYVDGQTKIQATNLNYVRDAGDTLPINTVLMGGWFSNSGSNPSTCVNPSPASSRYIDDVIISNQYVGPEPAVTAGSNCTEQVVAFTTPLAGTTQVEYGQTGSYGSLTAVDSAQVTNHSKTLTGLNPGKAYHYRVKSTWSNGYQYVSPDYTFVAR